MAKKKTLEQMIEESIPERLFVFHGGDEWSITCDESGREEIARVHIRVGQDPRHPIEHGKSVCDELPYLLARAPVVRRLLLNLCEVVRNEVDMDACGDKLGTALNDAVAACELNHHN